LSFATLRQRARLLKRDSLVLWFALRDPRAPWYARLVAVLVVAYALSPIDLIPDFIPILGYLDDLVLIPLGIVLCLKLMPPAVLADARVKAAALVRKPRNWAAALVIVLIWVGLAVLLGGWVYRLVAG